MLFCNLTDFNMQKENFILVSYRLIGKHMLIKILENNLIFRSVALNSLYTAEMID